MRMNISVPDDLAAEVRKRKLPVSAICQRAFRAELAGLIAADPALPSREVLAHLARDWNALAAEIERDHLAGAWTGQDSQTLRWCASHLLELLGQSA